MCNAGREMYKGEQYYLGVKRISAWPMNLGDYNKERGWTIPADEDPAKEGYMVQCPGGYLSWSPKEIFEDAYLPLGKDGSRITQEIVDKFLGSPTVTKFGPKTTLVHAKTLTGFEQIEVSSCVDPKNYDEAVGTEVATARIRNTLWKCLGFVLQWANSGLKQ